MFSFIIPCYNDLKLIKSCIKSIKSMISYDLILCEIIVVDNSDVNLSFENEIFQNIKIIKNGSNLGFGAAINKGIKISKNKFIVIINNDIILDKNWLLNAREFIENNNDIFDLYSTTIMQHSKDDLIDSTGFKLTKGFGIITNRNLRVNQITKDFSVFGPVAACAIYNRAIFRKIGFFFEKYFLYEEDIDIAIRAHLYGYKCGHIMNAKSTHVGSASLGYYSPVKQYYISRNKIWLFFLNMHNEIMLKSLFFFLIHQFFILMKSIRYFNVYSYFSGVMDAFKELNKLSSVRNFRQSKVKISPNDFYNNLSKINLRNKILGQ